MLVEYVFCNICMCLLMHLRSNLGNLVCIVNDFLSSRDSSSQHQTGTVGPLALLFEGTHQLLQTREERDTATVFRIIAYFYTDRVLLILMLTLMASDCFPTYHLGHFLLDISLSHSAYKENSYMQFCT